LTPLLLPALLLAAPVPQAEPAKLPAPARQIGDASVGQLTVHAPRHAAGDPLERLNRRFFRSNQKFDRALFRPTAMGYKHAVPRPVRSALRNIFSNLGEPIVFLNYLLQLKPGKAAETAVRFAINSTIGLGGALDLAKQPSIRLPHRPNGLGNTLGYYGVRPGPYLFLPFVGPTTLRDLLGGFGDGAVLPTAVGTPFDRVEYQVPKGVITGLDARAEADDELGTLFAGAVDPYATLRSVFLQNRAGEIAQLHGRPKVTATQGELDDPLADLAAGGSVGAQPVQSSAAELQDPLADPSTPAASPPDMQDPLSDPAAAPVRPQASAPAP
jgi:phospholipid-binding lipoprotein MlaA